MKIRYSPYLLGAKVCPIQDLSNQYREKLEDELELISAEARLKGLEKEDFLKLCEEKYGQMNPDTQLA